MVFARRLRQVQPSSAQLSLFTEDSGPTSVQTGKLPDIAIRESARAKRLSIKVFPRGRVEVVVPRRTRPADVEAFVSENRRWIDGALESFADELDPGSFALPTVIDLAAVQKRYVVAYRRRRGTDAVRYRELGQTLVLTGDVDNESTCTTSIRRWLAKVARRELEPLLAELSAAYQLPYQRLQIRAQRTCWGSHSSSGTISLNVCLLFLEPAIVRYLLIHELCHARHMNHSAAFWRLVSCCEPAYRRLDKQLGESWRQVPGWVGVY